MNQPPIPPFSFLRIEELVAVLVIVGTISLLSAHALPLYFQDVEPVIISYESPAPGQPLRDNEDVSLAVRISGGTYPMTAYVLVSYEQLPALENVFTSISFSRSGSQTLTYSPDPVFPAGTYYWRIITYEPSTGQATYGRVQNFTIEETTSEEPEPTPEESDYVGEWIDSAETAPLGSCPGGPGGFTAPPGGEKTYVSSPIPPLGVQTVSFNHPEKHGIEKIQIETLSTPLPASGIILYPWALTPGLSDAQYPYRLVDFKTTNPWDNADFFVRVFFRVDRVWMDERNLAPHNIALYAFENGEWVEQPTRQMGEDPLFFRFEGNIWGFHPIEIAGCPHLLNISYPFPPLKEVPFV